MRLFNMNHSIIVTKDNMITTNHNTFQGWGSSLCWWANRIGYSDSLTRQAAELFYGESGLALNIMRYNIGGGDDPAHDHIRRTDSAIPGWTKWDPVKKTFVYDVQADSNQLHVLQQCYQKAGKYAYVEAFSNSAPYYMTKSGCTSGNEDPSQNNLKEECYDEFALYLATVCHYLTNEFHIPVYSIAAMNEPNTPFWVAMSAKQEGCHFDPGESQSRMLVATKTAFSKMELNNIEITASDETSTDKQLLACQSFSQEAWDVIDRISTHTYEIERRKELGHYIANHNHNLWMSEVDGSFTSGKNAGEMGAALGFAQKILDDINELSPSAWVMWQLIDNHICANGFYGNKDFGMPDTTKGYWGVAVADHDNDNIILTKKYYALGQFTRYLRPGSQMIRCDEHALAAFHPDTKQLAIVVVNSDEAEQSIQIDVSEWISEHPKTTQKKATVIRTSGSLHTGENWAECPPVFLQQEVLNTTLKGYSVTTFLCN